MRNLLSCATSASSGVAGIQELNGLAAAEKVPLLQHEAQHLHGLRPGLDSRPRVAWPMAALEDGAFQAEAFQHDGACQAVEARADDRNPHALFQAPSGGMPPL